MIDAMRCIGAVKRILVSLGVMPNFTRAEMQDAVTEDLVAERGKVMAALTSATEGFRDKSEKLVAEVGEKKSDLETVLEKLKAATTATADARSLIENMMARRRNTQ